MVNRDENNGKNRLVIAYVAIIVSIILFAISIAWGFWNNDKQREERIAFTNSVLVRNCKDDRSQDRILLGLLREINEGSPYSPGFLAAQKTLEKKASRSCGFHDLR